MAVVNIGHYYAEWMPSGSPEKSGRGRIILRSATRLSELFRLTNLGSEDAVLGQRGWLAAHCASADA